MSKNYSFEFPGTKEMFLELLNKYPHDNSRLYYFDDYIIEISENEIRFGISRGSHSGGYWFIPTITAFENKTVFSGKLQYIDAFTGEKGVKKVINKIGEFLFFILMLPIFLIIRAYLFISLLVRKIINRPKPKTESPEDRLYELMENHLNCIQK